MTDMKIQGIGIGNIDQLKTQNSKLETANVEGKSFGDVLKESINRVDSIQKEADHAIQEMVSGSGDIHNAMIALEQANISFQVMMQVRNKIVSAYEEVMRTQV